MDNVYKVYFSLNPPINQVMEMMDKYSGLQLQVFKNNNNIVLEYSSMPAHRADIRFVKRGKYLDNLIDVDCDHVTIDIFAAQMNYLEGVALAVLIDLGGKIELTKPLPPWAREKWRGEQWWKKVGNHPGLLTKLIEKFL